MNFLTVKKWSGQNISTYSEIIISAKLLNFRKWFWWREAPPKLFLKIWRNISRFKICLHFESGLCFLFVLVSDVTIHSEREKFILYCNCIFFGVSDGLIHLIFNLIWPKGFPKVCHCPLRLKNHFNWLKFCFHCIFIQLNSNKSILEVSIRKQFQIFSHL